jgi:phage terminase small subunit
MPNEKQLIAVREYLRGKSKATAMRTAGYAESVCTDHPEYVFDHPVVQTEIKRRQMENDKKHEVSVSWLIQKMMDIINSETVSDSNKLRALELLGKNKGMFQDKLEISMKEDLVERLQRGRDRIAKDKAEEI